MSDQYAYWLASMQGISSYVCKQLFSVCRTAEEIYGLSPSMLEKVPNLTQKNRARILDAKKTWDLDGAWQQFAASGMSLTSWEEPSYPPQLRELADAPYGIFYRGSLPQPDGFRVAVVGARMCSEYGRDMAREIARELAKHDGAVVSGMAGGIDAAGHRGAMDSGGETYAVFGCGVDICYPNYHRQLYYEIERHGGLLSEYPPGTRPFPYHFPKRNRIISVLSDVVIIIEAKEKSGSLITADFAMEQGRDIYVLPGRVTDALSSGCNKLIAQGAGIILSVEDLMEELFLEARRKRPDTACDKNFAKIHNFSLEKEEQLVYGCLGILPTGFEDILKMTGLNTQTVSRILAALMQNGYIEEIFKNHYKIRT